MRPTHSLTLLAGHSVVKTADSIKESSISLESVNSISKIQLVAYHQCCVLIG